MATRVTSTQPNHPAPHRGRVGLSVLFFGLLAGPFAWSGQLLVNYGLSSHFCYPDDTPLIALSKDLGWLWPFLIAIGVLALAISAAGTLVSLRSWRMTREEASGHMVDIGEGRTRFLALWGMLTSGGFFLVVLLDFIALFVLPLCR
jgi:hypothetical protein